MVPEVSLHHAATTAHRGAFPFPLASTKPMDTGLALCTSLRAAAPQTTLETQQGRQLCVPRARTAGSPHESQTGPLSRGAGTISALVVGVEEALRVVMAGQDMGAQEGDRASGPTSRPIRRPYLKMWGANLYEKLGDMKPAPTHTPWVHSETNSWTGHHTLCVALGMNPKKVLYC